MEDVAKFLFVGAAAVALFAFLSVATWVEARAAERRDRERMALLRKLAELPPEQASVMREILREEDVRMERLARRKARQARRDGVGGGAIVMAVGVGLALFLFSIQPDEQIWTLGIMILLIGIVIAAFAYFGRPDGVEGHDRDTAAAG